MRAINASNSSFLGLIGPARRPQSDLDHEIAIAQQHTYINNSLMMAGVNALNSTVIMFSFIGIVALPVLLTWYGLLCVFTAFGLYLWRRTRKSAVPTRSSGRFLRKAEFSALLLGFTWGMPNILFANGDPALSMFFMLVSASTAAGFVSMVSAAPRITSRFVGAASVPIILNAVFSIEVYGAAVALLAVVLVFGLVNGSILSYKQLRALVEARLEANQASSDLYGALETIKDGFAIHGENGEIETSNSRYRTWFPGGFDVASANAGGISRVGEETWVRTSLVPLEDGRTVSIHTDVTGLKQREQQLIAARREAEDANAAKARFMSTMSHELRTPLNIINGFSQIMSTRSKVPVTAQEMREYSDSIHDAGEHLLTVVNDIIEFSQVGTDRYIHDPAAHAVPDLLARAVSLSARFHGVEDISGIDISVSPDLGEVIVDEAAFRRVLMSLMSNAIKFSGGHARFAVRAFLSRTAEPVIVIRDFGHGIPKADLPRVFDAFFQCDADRGGEFSGTGLGLTLARELMRLHNGDVQIASREGKGTTVSILLPADAHIPPSQDQRLEFSPGVQRSA